jgi:phosphatidylglycerophosphate synthase
VAERRGRELKIALIFAVALAAAVVVFLRAPIPQPPGYHAFADQRTLLVQYLPILLIPLIVALFPSALVPTRYVWALLAAYVVAKALELLDGQIYRAIRLVSGHSLKHVAAAAGLYFLVVAIRRRRLRVT